MRRKCFYLLEVCAIMSLLPSASLADLTCEALLMLSGNVSLQSLAATWNQTLSNATSQWSGSGIYCETSIDGIGTCWPRSSAGQLVARPCPEMFYGVRYNTTNGLTQQLGVNSMSEFVFAQAVQKWLRYAPDRLGGAGRTSSIPIPE